MDGLSIPTVKLDSGDMLVGFWIIQGAIEGLPDGEREQFEHKFPEMKSNFTNSINDSVRKGHLDEYSKDWYLKLLQELKLARTTSRESILFGDPQPILIPPAGQPLTPSSYSAWSQSQE